MNKIKLRKRSFNCLLLIVTPCCYLIVLLIMTGCETDPLTKLQKQSGPEPAHLEMVALREGDLLTISFPGSPNLNTTQQIRRDGKISLPLVGEIKAAGLTAIGLEKIITNLCAAQLVSKEVTVAVQNSNFPVFVTGAILHPGKIVSDHPLTALEAVMEAGGFDYTKADLKNVMIIRQESSGMRHYVLNLKLIMDGKASWSFYLKPTDIVYVPERFSWL